MTKIDNKDIELVKAFIKRELEDYPEKPSNEEIDSYMKQIRRLIAPFKKAETRDLILHSSSNMGAKLREMSIPLGNLLGKDIIISFGTSKTDKIRAYKEKR